MGPYDLSDLDAFVAIAEARSFRGAAKLRNASPSALSDAIRRLESRLDVRLLNRTTRSVTPTAAGALLLDRLKPALAEASDAVASIYRDAKGKGGTLRLNVPSAVADLILPDIIPRFMERHPEIILDITAENNFVDVLAAGFDAGIRYDESLEKDMIALPIGPRSQRFVAAASPQYLAQHGTPTHPNDLIHHACIRFRFSSGVTHSWEFQRDNEVIKITPNGPLITNRIGLQVAAAVAGHGIVASFEGFLAPSLQSGALVEILPEWSDRFTGPFLYYASRRHMPGPLRAFVDFVKADNRNTP
jgi:DNA-binding transcriptional LysR family regulator